MARDLIPPPSPAGRPEPDSSEKLRRDAGLWAGGEPADPLPGAAVIEPEAPAARAAAPGPSPYRSRFGFVLGALIGIALAACGAGLLLAGRASDEVDGARWSAWQPGDGDEIAVARRIAEHVAPRYRLGDGSPLTAVRASPFEIATPPVPFSVVVRDPAGAATELEGNGVLYTLDGLGRNGSIITGKPSAERHLLLRREALELSLYTFRFAEDVDMVVTLLPPRAPEPAAEGAAAVPQPLQALLLRPADLADRLAVPLEETLARTTPKPAAFKPDVPEAQTVELLTGSNLFEAAFQQGQDAKAHLVLSRPLVVK